MSVISSVSLSIDSSIPSELMKPMLSKALPSVANGSDVVPTVVP